MRLLLPIFDDSSLIFAARLRNLVAPRGWTVDIPYFLHQSGEEGISERQFQLHGVERREPLAEADFLDLLRQGHDALIVCRILPIIDSLLKDPAFRANTTRPCFIAFQPGLELSPRRAFRNRMLFDTAFLNNRNQLDELPAADIAKCADLRFGHPYFLAPDPAASARGRNIYFFAQAISPNTRRAREHVIDVLLALAEANPDREVVLKLRHLPDENQNHLHRERYAYPALIAARGEALPPNLRYSACSMQEALADAAVCLTCTSTAAIDAVSAGVPVMVYTDYVDYWQDPLSAPTAREFQRSGLLASLEQVLALDIGAPKPSWIAGTFVTADRLCDEIAAAAARWRGIQEEAGAWTDRPAPISIAG